MNDISDFQNQLNRMAAEAADSQLFPGRKLVAKRARRVLVTVETDTEIISFMGKNVRGVVAEQQEVVIPDEVPFTGLTDSAEAQLSEVFFKTQKGRVTSLMFTTGEDGMVVTKTERTWDWEARELERLHQEFRREMNDEAKGVAVDEEGSRGHRRT